MAIQLSLLSYRLLTRPLLIISLIDQELFKQPHPVHGTQITCLLEQRHLSVSMALFSRASVVRLGNPYSHPDLEYLLFAISAGNDSPCGCSVQSRTPSLRTRPADIVNTLLSSMSKAGPEAFRSREPSTQLISYYLPTGYNHWSSQIQTVGQSEVAPKLS